MSRKISFRVRQWHKWLSLIIGAQVMLWLATGVYMVVMNLDFIHGDHLVQNMTETLAAEYEPNVTFPDMLDDYPDASEIVLTSWVGQSVYRVQSPSGSHLVSAETGRQISPLTQDDAITVARYHYARTADVTAATLLVDKEQAPTEIQSRPLPLWRIDFDDAGSTAFYVSPDDGSLITRRHTFWRVFDFAWMLHIMDYEERADVNNTLLRISAGLGLVLSILGMWLLFFSFRRRRRNVA
ncbi:PepSY domain-containing protein [Hyphomonas sp.]|uniref:PepSY domain-containing protein n=1 Tax=Hyphomonas sp. TaxID=87 RepID=UPI0032D94724